MQTNINDVLKQYNLHIASYILLCGYIAISGSFHNRDCPGKYGSSKIL